MRKNPNGHDFDYIVIKASQIKFDRTYQRPIDESRVSAAVKKFNGDVYNEPKVSFRDYEYWCFDGQQSTEMWKAYHNNPDEPILVKVFYGMTWDDEVEAFILQRGFAKDVAETWKLRAKYNRGDIDVVDMVRIIRSLGWDIDFEKNTGSESGRIKAISALYKAYTKLGHHKFADMMQVIREAWGMDENAVRVQIISGMKTFYNTFYGSFRHDDLVSSLKKTVPLNIIRYGKSNAAVQSNTYAKEIWKQYNQRRRTRLPDRL